MEKRYLDITTLRIETDDITKLSPEALSDLKCGDIVVKITGKQKHCYRVSYKGDGVGEGLCLTYADASRIETHSYDFTVEGWVYNSVDVWENA